MKPVQARDWRLPSGMGDMTNSNVRTTPQVISRRQIGNAVHAMGIVLAALLILHAAWLAITWSDLYGALALLSGALHASATYLVANRARHIVDPSYRSHKTQKASADTH